MRILVLCDDHYHPASTARAGLAELGNCGFEFDWVENADEWSAERMAGYPLVVLTKSDNVSETDQRHWFTEKVQKALVDYVRQGNGLLVVHTGTVYAQMPVLRGLIGGAFIRHRKQCPVTVEPREGRMHKGNIDAGEELPAYRAQVCTFVNGEQETLVVDSVRGTWKSYC